MKWKNSRRRLKSYHRIRIQEIHMDIMNDLIHNHRREEPLDTNKLNHQLCLLRKYLRRLPLLK